MVSWFNSMFLIIFFIFIVFFILPAFFLQFGNKTSYNKSLRVCYLIFVLFLLIFVSYVSYNAAILIV